MDGLVRRRLFMEVTNLPPAGDDQKRLNDKPQMSWLGYSLFVLLSLVLGVISAFLWMVNPFTDLLLILAAPPLRLLGYHPPVQGWSGLGSAMTVGFLWPRTRALVELPHPAMENLELRRVASLNERRRYVIGASGTGRPMTRTRQRASTLKTG